MSAITIRNLNKTYAGGTVALEDVDLDVASGDFFALLGANGAGKTTLIGILTDLVRKTSGTVHIFGRDIDRDFSKAKEDVGVVPQEFNFSIFEKTRDILITQGGYFGMPLKAARLRAEELLNQLGLWHKRNDIARTLSGGMKRRLMIARALIHDPKLLILDEPTAGVDVELRHGMWDFLRARNAEGLTVLLTTHYLEEVEQLCRQAAIIKDGRIVINERVSRLVHQLEREIYKVVVDEARNLDQLLAFDLHQTEPNTFEVELNKRQGLHHFILKLTEAGMSVVDFRPKGHRLEQLFLEVLKKTGSKE